MAGMRVGNQIDSFYLMNSLKNQKKKPLSHSVPVNVDADGGVDMKDLHKKIEQFSAELVI